VSAQDVLFAVRLLAEIEGRLHLPRRMIGRDVQLGEIVVVILDVRTLGDGEAKIGEDRGDLVEHLRNRMNATLRFGPGRQRDVDRLVAEARIQSRIAEFDFACGDGVRDFIAQAVEQRTIDLAFVRLHGAERLQKLADRPFLAERCHADRFQCGFVRPNRYGAQ